MRKQLVKSIALFSATLLAGCGVQFHRVPPRQSLNVALAQKAIAIAPPPPVAPSPAGARFSAGSAVEPELPDPDVERVADLMSKANFCLQTGNAKDALAAYEEVIKIKPDFAEAHYYVAVLYQRTGEEKKALENFKKYKELVQH